MENGETNREEETERKRQREIESESIGREKVTVQKLLKREDADH